MIIDKDIAVSKGLKYYFLQDNQFSIMTEDVDNNNNSLIESPLLPPNSSSAINRLITEGKIKT